VFLYFLYFTKKLSINGKLFLQEFFNEEML